MKRNPLISLEAATRFELVNSGFADRCLTTWLCRQKKMERETGFELRLPLMISVSYVIPYQHLINMHPH